MKIFIAGAGGQLGSELRASQPDGHEILAAGLPELDITDPASIAGHLRDFRPDWIINCAAYTAVDRAEEERGAAYRVNAEGAGNLARAAVENNARLLHVSTDFVFSGQQNRPYQPGDVTGPLGAYGASKLAGEQEVLGEIAERCVLIRIAWVYSVYGNNFVKTMLRLMRERDAVSVVCDQIGTPTWTGNFVAAIWRAIDTELASGVYHWTDLGACSWYDFAVAIQEEALHAGILDRAVPVRPIFSDEYPMLARRPFYTVLDTAALRTALDLPGQHWRVALRHMLATLREETTP